MAAHLRNLTAGLLLLAGVLLLVIACYRPPAPRGPDTPATEFSAARARAVLRELAGDGRPRAVGTPGHAAARGRITARLTSLGYETSVQRSYACGEAGQCAPVANILARRPASAGGKAVVLMAHYDSVPAGPGASDDAVGVAAVLEVARALAGSPPAGHPVVFLITDAEELGLLGARAFAAEHPWAAEVGVVVNLEARGTGGVSLLFETGFDNAWLIGEAARHLRRPAASSVFDTIYRRLPNDTDFTVFKERRLPGANFAYIGDPLRYHTPQDSFANADPGSLQHHGNQALALARALAGADLERPPGGDAVFFDLLTLTLVRWPAGWSAPLAALALALIAAVAARWRRRGLLAVSAFAWGIAGWLLAVAAGALVGAAVTWVARRAGAAPGAWIAHPVPLLLAVWLGAAAAAIAAWIVVGGRARPAGAWVGTWLPWAAVALVLAVAAPGIAYLFLAPSLVAALAALPAARRGEEPGAAMVLVPAVAAGLLWFPLAWFLYEGMGVGILVAIGVLVALVGGTLGAAAAAPRPATAAARAPGAWPLPVAIGAFAVAALAAALFLDPFTPQAPRPLNLYHLEEAGEEGDLRARWLASVEGELPAPLRAAAPFRPATGAVFPWAPDLALAEASAPALGLEPPRLTRQGPAGAAPAAGRGRRVAARLISPRGADRLRLCVAGPGAQPGFVVEGRAVPEPAGGAEPVADGEWRCLQAWGLTTRGVRVDITLPGGGPATALLCDQSLGLPAAATLAAARPPDAAPIGGGDGTIVCRRLTL